MKLGKPSDIGIEDPVDGGCVGMDRHPRIDDQLQPSHLALVGVEPNPTEFDDPIGSRIKAGRLQIDRTVSLYSGRHNPFSLSHSYIDRYIW